MTEENDYYDRMKKCQECIDSVICDNLSNPSKENIYKIDKLYRMRDNIKRDYQREYGKRFPY